MKKQPINKDKLAFWQKELKKLEEIELPKAMKRVGESTPQGDWHENIEFEEAERQVQYFQTRIRDIKNMVTELGKKN